MQALYERRSGQPTPTAFYFTRSITYCTGPAFGLGDGPVFYKDVGRGYTGLLGDLDLSRP